MVGTIVGASFRSRLDHLGPMPCENEDCGDTVYIGLGTVALAVSSDEGLEPQQRIEKEMPIDCSTKLRVLIHKCRPSV